MGFARSGWCKGTGPRDYGALLFSVLDFCPGSVASVEFGTRVKIGGASGFLGAVRIMFGRSSLHGGMADRTVQPLRQGRCRNNDETESGQRNLRIERVHFKNSVLTVARARQLP